MADSRFKDVGSTGLFDRDFTWEKLEALGNPLKRLSEVIDFELFRADLESLTLNAKKTSAASQKPCDPVMMFKILVIKMFGIGPEEDFLKSLVSKLGIETSVEFQPSVPMEKIREEIRYADACCVTSNGREGWGVAVNEIMLEGRCVVASNATGAGITSKSDLLKHRNCP
jgi:glycosyltransferase involved in cell wall biosynthesis